MAGEDQSENQILEERKAKIMAFLHKKQQWLYYIGLAIVIWFGGIFIRTANISKLKDVTGGMGGFALAPDLDPYLFLRWAKYIAEHGKLMAIDTMRYVPLGYKTVGEMPVVPYGIAYLHKFLSFFSDITIEYAAIIFPVIFFILTAIIFFFLVRKIFENYKNCNLIALISTAFLAVIPGFIHRTTAGVPEKESAAFFFMFLAFYFIVSAWKEDKIKKATIFGLLAGLSTGLMGLTWGGVTFAFIAISLSAFVAFFASEFKAKDIFAYAGWIIGFTPLLFFFPRFGTALFTSTTSGFAYFVLALFIFDSLLFKTKAKQWLENVKLPQKAISLIGLIAIAFFAILVISPSLIVHVFEDVKSQLITPFEGSRFTVTVAENNRPFFNSWKGAFGNFFWVFFLGSIFLFFEAVKKLKDKKSIVLLTTAFTVLIFGIVFTRLRPDSILNGSSAFSITLFLGSIGLFALSIIYVYLKNPIEVDKSLVFILAWFFFALLSARSAIRMLYFLYPIAPIIGAFTIVKLSEMTFKSKDEVAKISIGVIALLAIVLSAWSFYGFSVSAYNEVNYASVPSHYNLQWQKAMNWTRESTPENAVFGHWWDYGYWVQTLGERPTILDGGNSIVYWDHLLGRHVLTGVNETDALEFLLTHNASYLLIDSTDIGKYSAFSSIGSDEDYDRFSWIATFTLDEKATQEKRNETLLVFAGGTMLDEDLMWQDRIFAAESAGIAGFILPIRKINNSDIGQLGQPEAVVVSNEEQTRIPIKCIYLDGKIEFEKGIEGCLYIMPLINEKGMKKMGAGLWLSPRLMRSLFSKFYLFDETESFELVHSEENLIIEELRAQGLEIPEFAIYGGSLLGPIKIWKINYPEDIQIKPEYLETDYPEDSPGLWQVRK